MSKFSSYLRELLEKNGASISAVSRSIGAERTSIHKALSDERVLPYKTVASLARYLRLTLDERQEFFRLYNILLQGEESYRSCQAVCSLLNHLSTVHFQMAPPPTVPNLSGLDGLIKGEYAVRSAIRSVLLYEVSHTEEAEFQFFLPHALDLTMELMELWLNDYRFSVSQLLCFQNAGSDASANIGVLKQIVPLCLASRGSYHPWYFREQPGALALQPLGCYIITPHYLIQFDRELSAAQIRNDPEIVAFFGSHFTGLLQYCEPLTKCSTSILDVLQQYIANASPDALRVMMPQPCPGRYITQDVITKYLNSDDIPYQQMFDLVDRRFSSLRRIDENFYTLFTEEGLLDLLQTHVLDDLPPQYVPPLEAGDIGAMMQMLREEIAAERIHGLIARPMYLQLPDYLVIYADEQTGIQLYTTNKFIYGAYSCIIQLNEASICQAFLEFFRTLPGSYMVYSKEETLSVLDNRLAAYQKSLTP